MPRDVPADQHRRRLRLQAALWAAVLAAYVVLMVVAYFTLPPRAVNVSDYGVALLLVLAALGLLVVVFLTALRGIPSARVPLARSISVLVLVFVPFVLGFSYLYLSLAASSPGEIPGLETHMDALYFTVTLITTVGFGDVAPAGQVARAAATIQMLFNVVFLGFFVKIALDVAQRTRAQRRREGLPVAFGGMSDDHGQWQAAPDRARDGGDA